MTTHLMTRTYSELCHFSGFLERFRYLKLSGVVGKSTFGYDRYLNQYLYKSSRWKRTRDLVIIRDNGCDLGTSGYPINGSIIVHHMNPISEEDIELERDIIFNVDCLISTSIITHKAIHYGNEDLLPRGPIVRRQNDTTPWKK